METPLEKHRKNKRLRPPPELLLLDKGIRVLLCLCMEHYSKVAAKAIARMRQLPKHDRPDWYENNITYWKHVQRGLMWVKDHVSMIGKRNGVTPADSAESPDSILPIGSDEAIARHRRRIRDWFEPL